MPPQIDFTTLGMFIIGVFDFPSLSTHSKPVPQDDEVQIHATTASIIYISPQKVLGWPADHPDTKSKLRSI